MSIEKILTLVGKGDNGKTTVIKFLQLKLLAQEDKFVLIDCKGKTNAQMAKEIKEHWYTDKHHNVVDKTLTFNYKDRFNIVVSSLGDDAERLDYVFKIANRNNSKLVFCASHDSDVMYNNLQKRCTKIERSYKFKIYGTKQEIKLENEQLVYKLYEWLINALEGITT